MRQSAAMADEPESWTLTLPCTRAEAENVDHEDARLWELGEIPTFAAREPDPAKPEAWEISAYFSQKPSAADIKLIQSLFPSATKAKPMLEKVAAQDWVTLSQQGLAPVRSGRFFIHTSSYRGDAPQGAVTFQIEASRAFGTGGHETTSRCLAMLDKMARQGAHFRNIADIGTGTGLLAFAARHLWPIADVTASDIDPISIEISEENAAVNGVPLGQLPGQVALCVASGTDHELIQRRAPYDLIIANILAGPLIELAPALSAILAEGGTLILAGLLDRQVDAVRSAYWRQGLRLADQDVGEWPCLRLVKRPRYGWRRPQRVNKRTSQPPGDFGTW